MDFLRNPASRIHLIRSISFFAGVAAVFLVSAAPGRRLGNEFNFPICKNFQSSVNSAAKPFATDSDFGVTDKGRRLPVFQWIASESSFEFCDTGFDEKNENWFWYDPWATDNHQSNCHGWVFVEGSFLIFGSQVEQILAENDYAEVNHPAAGDVIIYRDSRGKVIHSGLVREAGTGSPVLIESKWGLGPIFQHFPQEQPYSDFYKYYRTQRGSNSVKIVAIDGERRSGLSQTSSAVIKP